jgi:hypothetical protein
MGGSVTFTSCIYFGNDFAPQAPSSNAASKPSTEVINLMTDFKCIITKSASEKPTEYYTDIQMNKLKFQSLLKIRNVSCIQRA